MMTGFVFSAVFSPTLLRIVRATTVGQVVISEIAWAGSTDSSTDEWIELYNNSSQSIDLANWHIVDDLGASDYKILSGSIPAHGYFLIEDHESAIQNVTADAIIDLSLANTGDSLQLYDGAGQLIDTVNGSGGAWYAGNATTHASMERIDPVVLADASAQWSTSTGVAAGQVVPVSSGGGTVVGTPKSLNSVTQTGGNSGGSGSTVFTLTADQAALQSGNTITLTGDVQDVQNLFVYGFDLHYDPAVLHYRGAFEGNFLHGADGTQTTFQSGLLNGQEGSLFLAGARTGASHAGVNGSGKLFEVQFDVVSGGSTTLQIGSGSFLADPTADIPVVFHDLVLSPGTGQLGSVAGLSASQGVERYSITLNWSAVSGAEAYRVYRKDAHGVPQLLGEVPQPGFTDKNGVMKGGFIIPSTNYVYQVIAVAGAVESAAVEVVGRDERGLKGDNNRSDLVDGRDLERLAQRFALDDTGQGFDPLVDTTYDGRIDGSDLIDYAANFAMSYQL